METLTVDPMTFSSQVRRALNWYTHGFLTEEELVHILEQSIENPQNISVEIREY